MLVNQEHLDFWVKHNLNVLFEGHAGVGKTAIVIETFKRHSLKYKYFSASTMDPWVDFVGVPKEKKDSNGKSYLDMVLPRDFAEDDVEAIFIDEFNRCNPKINNAIMELIQFKSINGRKFNNLRFIWAAINPHDEETEEYHVGRLDPAHLDRFQIQFSVPYVPDGDYFKEKYGEEISSCAISWWNSLKGEQRKKVSPRRLDYALDIYNKGGDMRHVLPQSSNVSELQYRIANGDIIFEVAKNAKVGNVDKVKSILSNKNNYMIFEKAYVNMNRPEKRLLAPFIIRDKLASMLLDNPKVWNALTGTKAREDMALMEIFRSIVRANTNKKLVKKIQTKMPEIKSKLSLHEEELKTTTTIDREKTYRTLRDNYEWFLENNRDQAAEALKTIAVRTHKQKALKDYKYLGDLLKKFEVKGLPQEIDYL